MSRIKQVEDEALLDEMGTLQSFIKQAVGTYLTIGREKEVERVGLNDMHIVSILVQISCELAVMHEIPQKEFAEMVDTQFHLTHQRMAEKESLSATKQ